jgi:predicted small metal-binding protein
MKTMTCNQLGGACDTEFSADSFDEMAQLSQQHGAEMAQQGDEDHLAAMETMSEMMQDPEAMQEWMNTKKQEFEATPDDN